MKTISMDFSIYEDDLERSRELGNSEGKEKAIDIIVELLGVNENDWEFCLSCEDISGSLKDKFLCALREIKEINNGKS